MQEFIKNKPTTGRNASFEKTLELILNTFGKNPINIVEAGTIRSDSDTSRYGDGWGTLNWKYFSEYTGAYIWSVDIDINSLNSAKRVVPSDDHLCYVHKDSVEFLKEFDKEIDVLFLDSYDYCGDEENIRKCHEHQLNEVKAALPKMSEKSIILVDDIFDISFNGSGKLSIPYLLSHGYELVHCFDSQALLRKKILTKENPKVSCVMTTYGRFNCVEMSVGMFLKQDYTGPKELIIYNTDIEHPYELDDTFEPFKSMITIVNNNTDKITGKPYTNVGAIRRDAIDYATGELYICWDDDDVFLPWNIRQGVERLLESGKRAWKPKYSFFHGGMQYGDGKRRYPEYQENVMEASVIVYIEELRSRGFKMETGSEHCGWYQELVDEGKFLTDADTIPGYCFNWSRSTGVSDHKQSGDINNKDNFNNHKKQSTDHAQRPLTVIHPLRVDAVLEDYYIVLREKKKKTSNLTEKELLNKYVPKELVFISAQPDDKYFSWQIEVQINNFRKYNLSHKMHVLVYHNERPKWHVNWDKLQKAYPEVNFFFYKNIGLPPSNYIPILRPHILKQHFAKYPELEEKAIFYHDSDIIFTKYLDLNKLAAGDTWYLSDTVSYIGANYIKSKGDYIFKEMCNIVGINPSLVENNEQNSGGAQYLAKNMNAKFWEKVEGDCLTLYNYMLKVNNEDLLKRTPSVDIQAWCADMWSVLWNALYFGSAVNVTRELSFAWATSGMTEYNSCAIFHCAGATPDRKDLFYKGQFINKYPYKQDFSYVDPAWGSFKYVEAIKEVEAISCLID